MYIQMYVAATGYIFLGLNSSKSPHNTSVQEELEKDMLSHPDSKYSKEAIKGI